MSRPKQAQILPHRLEMCIDWITRAKECFATDSEAWQTLDRCEHEIRSLLSSLLAK